MKIIFKTPENPDGATGVSVIHPASGWITPNGKLFKDLTGDEILVAMEELAQKDVPTGLKYKIVEDSAISSDRTFRDAWEIDEAELTDGVGA